MTRSESTWLLSSAAFFDDLIGQSTAMCKDPATGSIATRNLSSSDANSQSGVSFPERLLPRDEIELVLSFRRASFQPARRPLRTRWLARRHRAQRCGHESPE